MGPPAPEGPSRTPGSMARKPTEEAISTWKNRKQTPADANTNGTTNLLFIAASSSTSNMGPEQARAQRLTDLCFLGAADFYFEGTAAADRLLLQAQPPRKRPQPDDNTDENSLKQALTLGKCRKLPDREQEERWRGRCHDNEDFRPISLAEREYMKRVKKIREQLGLPRLRDRRRCKPRRRPLE